MHKAEPYATTLRRRINFGHPEVQLAGPGKIAPLGIAWNAPKMFPYRVSRMTTLPNALANHMVEPTAVRLNFSLSGQLPSFQSFAEQTAQNDLNCDDLRG